MTEDRLTDAELDELLGAYALDAIDPIERAQIELYLDRSPAAAREVAAHLEVASMIGNIGGEAPEEIWDGIASRLSFDRPVEVASVPQLLPPEPETWLGPRSEPARPSGTSHTEPPPLGRSSSGRARTASRPARVALRSIAVAASLAVGFGIGRTVDRSDGENARTSIEALAIEARTLQGTKEATLSSKDGRLRAVAVVARNGDGYILGEELPELPAGEVYQLWGVKGDRVLSLGVLGRRADAAAFSADEDWDAFAITAEKGPGVVQTEQTPIVSGPF